VRVKELPITPIKISEMIEGGISKPVIEKDRR
jgi:hypothetical protein